jgi:hypothetical protein
VGEHRVGVTVRVSHLTDVRRFEAEQNERVAHRDLEGGRVVAAGGGVEAVDQILRDFPRVGVFGSGLSSGVMTPRFLDTSGSYFALS